MSDLVQNPKHSFSMMWLIYYTAYIKISVFQCLSKNIKFGFNRCIYYTKKATKKGLVCRFNEKKRQYAMLIRYPRRVPVIIELQREITPIVLAPSPYFFISIICHVHMNEFAKFDEIPLMTL